MRASVTEAQRRPQWARCTIKDYVGWVRNPDWSVAGGVLIPYYLSGADAVPLYISETPAFVANFRTVAGVL